MSDQPNQSPDPATCRRLAAELREDDERMTRAPWSVHASARTRKNLPEIARQLEAAAEMAEERVHAYEALMAVRTERDAARTESDRLRTRVVELEAEVARWRKAGVSGIDAALESGAREIRALEQQLAAVSSRAVTAPMAREVTDHERRISQLETAVARMAPVSVTPPMVLRDYYVTVCSSCRRACCWHGEITCEANRSSGTVDVLASELVREWREHPSYFSVPRLRELCGEVRYVQGDAAASGGAGP